LGAADAIALMDAMATVSRLYLLHYTLDEQTTVTRRPQPDALQQRVLAAPGEGLPKRDYQELHKDRIVAPRLYREAGRFAAVEVRSSSSITCRRLS
jgi:hypothetical protein